MRTGAGKAGMCEFCVRVPISRIDFGSPGWYPAGDSGLHPLIFGGPDAWARRGPLQRVLRAQPSSKGGVGLFWHPVFPDGQKQLLACILSAVITQSPLSFIHYRAVMSAGRKGETRDGLVSRCKINNRRDLTECARSRHLFHSWMDGFHTRYGAVRCGAWLRFGAACQVPDARCQKLGARCQLMSAPHSHVSAKKK